MAEKSAADFFQVQRNDFAWIRGCEGDVALAGSVVEKGGDEKAFTRDHALEPLEHSAACGGLHLDSRSHVHHGPGFGTNALARVEFDFDQLHVVSVNFVIDDVAHGDSS